ncbi:hypothetical protein [Lonomia obliqua multiple nucleopolyhedrovirus]|uniref:Uncharacterized protein n=1 Tax=Lonomia obliqua multiple nucleopolyhedrovirus TaxID=134394 RepID=A0A126FCE4_9ABAC|nr:hypothetical protein [Lonomia obliqua multiple nucleopolyhedrovirus]AKN81072.1 hypothetical protein [Lonomia obliqua multiple nucleopolyhedrovirus]
MEAAHMHDNMNICLDNKTFAYTTDDLLKNIHFNSTKSAPFRYNHFITLKRLSNGLLDKKINTLALEEFKKLNFKIDHSINYITNIFDFEFIILDFDLSIVHILNSGTKRKIGHLNVSINNNDSNELIITVTLQHDQQQQQPLE